MTDTGGAMTGALSRQAVPAANGLRRRLLKNRLAVVGALIVAGLVIVAAAAPLIAPYDPIEQNLPEQLKGPGPGHLFGTDDFGRDIFSRVVYGARVTIQVGVISVAIGLIAGVALGLLAGFYGGLADSIIMRVMDVLLAFPGILLAIAIMAVLGQGLQNAMIAVGTVAIPTYARLVRSAVLSVKENEYIEAARAIGNSAPRVLAGHVLPNILAPIIVQSTLGLAYAILEAAALGFLGLGAQRPFPEWGLMLNDAQRFFLLSPHIAAFPGLAIMVTVLGFNLLGDGLRDVLDPRLKE
ncbi:MAG: ABC transporter permease [Actinobacteria bacterium]|nr:ABC transporter permease [Actinomycetota bacterium]